MFFGVSTWSPSGVERLTLRIGSRGHGDGRVTRGYRGHGGCAGDDLAEQQAVAFPGAEELVRSGTPGLGGVLAHELQHEPLVRLLETAQSYHLEIAARRDVFGLVEH